MKNQPNTPAKPRGTAGEASGKHEGLRHPVDDDQRAKQRMDGVNLDDQGDIAEDQLRDRRSSGAGRSESDRDLGGGGDGEREADLIPGLDGDRRERGADGQSGDRERRRRLLRLRESRRGQSQRGHHGQRHQQLPLRHQGDQSSFFIGFGHKHSIVTALTLNR